MSTGKAGEAPALTVAHGVATLTLRRPAHHNRIDPDDPEVILGHLRTLADTPGLTALVLRAAECRTFCSGYTLGQITTRLDRRFEDMLDAIERLPLPTVCALSGSVYGGGTDVAMACDFRLGVQGMRLFMPAVRFGLHYYPGGLRRFVTRIGPGATKKIFLTGQTLYGEELLRIGYLCELVPPLELDAAVARYVEALRDGAAQPLRSMKHDIDAIAAGIWSESAGRAHYEASLQTPETQARLSAQAAHKPPA